MSKKIVFFFIFLSAALSLRAQSDEYIYITVPGSPVAIVTLTVTMAAGESPTAFHIIDPSMSSAAPVAGSQPTGNQILSGNTFYYPYTATSPPHTKATLTQAGDVLTLVVERWNFPDERGYLSQGTWVFIIRDLNNPTTKSFNCLDINGDPIATCAALNAPPVVGISFDPAKTPSFDSTYCFVTSSTTQNIDFEGSATDPEGDSLAYSWESTNHSPTEFDTALDPAIEPFATDNSDVYDVTFSVTETFTGSSFTREMTDQVTVVVKNPPTAAIRYNQTGASDPYTAPATTYLVINQGDTIYFSGGTSVSNDPLAGDIEYFWDYEGDATVDDSGTDKEEVSHQYTASGQYDATLTVEDQYNNSSTAVTMKIMVVGDATADIQYKEDPLDLWADPPDLSVPANIPVNGKLAFDAADTAIPGYFVYFQAPAASVGSGYPAYFNAYTTTGYSWQINASAYSGSSATHKFTGVGEYEAELTVTFTINDTSVTPAYTDSVTKVVTMPVWVLSDEKIFFPPHVGVPYDYVPPDVLDNDIDDDGGWNKAHRVTYNYGTAAELLFFQTIRKNTNDLLYMGLQVEEDPHIDSAADMIVIALRAGTDRTARYSDNDRLLVIQPRTSSVEIYRMTAATETWSLVTSTITNYDKAVTVTAGTPSTWIIELQLPLSNGGNTDWVNIPNDFLLYVNFINSMTGSMTETKTWPRNIPDYEYDTTHILPHPVWWGDANRSTAVSGGVYIGYSDIVPPHSGSGYNIVVGQNNTFIVNVHNTTQIGGVDQTAPGINATFRVADWGIADPYGPGVWTVFPGVAPDINPTNHVSIPGASVQPYQAVWAVPSDYLTTHTQHQCILVELDSNSNANIITRSYFRNMTFADLTSGGSGGGDGGGGWGFKANPAAFDARGMDRLPQDAEKQKIYLQLVKKEWVVKEKIDDPKLLKLIHLDPKMAKRMQAAGGIRIKGKTAVQENRAIQLGLEKNISYMSYEIHGYRLTGKKIKIKGKEYDVVEDVGAFGQLVRYDADVEDWQIELEGLKRVGNNIYVVELEPETKEIVNINVKAIEHPRHSVSAHGGIVLPLAELADDYDIGFCGFADFHIHLIPELYQFSLMALVGYSYLPAKTSGVDDLSLLNVSVNARWDQLVTKPFYVYAFAGPAVYYVVDGSVEFGANAGAGIDVRISPYFSIGIGAIYQYLLAANEQFLQAHAGIAINF
jgi:hypothetical protein